VRYKLGFYISDDGILYSHGRANLSSYMLVTVRYADTACHASVGKPYGSVGKRLCAKLVQTEEWPEEMQPVSNFSPFLLFDVVFIPHELFIYS
jgi:hypothetical protein